MNQLVRCHRPAQLCGDSVPIESLTFGGSQTLPVDPATPQDIEIDEPMSFWEFATYTRCPLQHWYRYGVGLRKEQESGAAVRASFAVMNALHGLATDKACKPDKALESMWSDQYLPPKQDDPSLWEDAMIVLNRGP